MAAGRGREMVKPAWMKEEERKHVGRRSRSRSPPSRPKLRPPDRNHEDHQSGRGSERGRESARGREREREMETGRERERERERETGKERESERETGRERERERERETGKERERERETGRERERERERGRERVRETERHREPRDRDRRDRDQRHRSHSPERNGGPRRGKNEGGDEGAPRRNDHRRDDRGREETRPRPDTLSKESPEEQPPPMDASLAAMEAAQKALEEKAAQKAQPDFGYSGKLAEETNKVNGIALLFTEPPEARKPTRRWRLYVFKGDEPQKDPLYIHRQSCYLFGRERKIADIPTDHPSCSKQHAVIQYRLTEKEGADFMMKSVVVPYIMDLGSTNGTFLNGKRIEAQRYYELLEKDTVKFGNSTREYVLLHENSAGQ